MALFKRKSAPQFLIGLFSWGLPAPIRWFLGMRFVSRMAFSLLMVLIIVGVITLDWSNGWPKFSFDKQRATTVGTAAKDLASEARGYIPEGLAEKVREHIPEDVAEKVKERLPDGLGLDRWSSPIETSNAQSDESRPPPQPGATIRIASFNIQVFGTTKARKPEVTNVLASVVRRFDVVSIQELRTTDETVMENFVSLINSSGRSYKYVIGPRLGRTVSKEQYVFVYDAARIDVDPQSIMTVPDPQDYLHREPTIARFQARSSSTQPGFSFILANIHTDPDETDTELDALGDVFVSLQQNGWQEDDVILLGDLNVSYREFGKLGQVPNIAYTVQGQPTNTRGTKSYDNIVFDRLATTEFTGAAGILDLQREFSLTMDQAIEVSDHLPIWAEFDVHEHGAQIPVASRPIPPSTPEAIGRSQARLVENPLLRGPGYQR